MHPTKPYKFDNMTPSILLPPTSPTTSHKRLLSPPMSVISVRDILAFHKIDRGLYDRVLILGRNPAASRNIIALWMWLELIGVDVISYVKDCKSHSVVQHLVTEAEAILDCLHQDCPPLDNTSTAIPLTASLVVEPLNLRFFFCHRDMVVRGITCLLDGVGRLIFDDYLNRLLSVYEAALREAEEAGQRMGGQHWVPLPVLPSDLARPYEPRLVPSPEDCRSLFVTFSKGYPLKREDIEEYFAEKWGDCVEKVMMERTTQAAMPMYGRIVFRSDSFIGLVLNGEQLVKFMIKGKQLWARKYVPRNL